MTFERLMSRAFGKESMTFWIFGPRGLTIKDVEHYLAEGGDINRRTEYGNTLLHTAADNQQLDLVEFLIARGADVNARGACGYTPLHYAVDIECNTQCRPNYYSPAEFRVTKLLLQAGADDSLRDENGQTARDVAVEYGEAALYDLLPRRQIPK